MQSDDSAAHSLLELLPAALAEDPCIQELAPRTRKTPSKRQLTIRCAHPLEGAAFQLLAEELLIEPCARVVQAYVGGATGGVHFMYTYESGDVGGRVDRDDHEYIFARRTPEGKARTLHYSWSVEHSCGADSGSKLGCEAVAHFAEVLGVPEAAVPAFCNLLTFFFKVPFLKETKA